MYLDRAMTLRHHSLVAWQRADDLFIKLHQLTIQRFPSLERFELSSQLRRAAYSVPANIAEDTHAGTSAIGSDVSTSPRRRSPRFHTACTSPSDSATSRRSYRKTSRRISTASARPSSA